MAQNGINENKSLLLSIIVPVYNTEERYLERCLSSIGSFTRGVEVIIVDDGSAWDTALYLQHLVASLTTPHVLLKRENGGQNSARNMGIEAARADYVMFLDSDDFLDTEALHKLMDKLRKTRPQLLGFNYRRVDEAGNSLKSYDLFGSSKDKVERAAVVQHTASLCTYAYRRDLFADGYRLVENVHVGEDLASVVPLVLRAEPLMGCDLIVYNYVQRKSSVTHTYNSAVAFDILGAFDALLSRLDKAETAAFHDEIEWLCILHVIYFGSKRAIDSGLGDRTNLMKLRSYVDSRFPDWYDNQILARELEARNQGFRLLINGHFKTYMILHLFKQTASRLKSIRAEGPNNE